MDNIRSDEKMKNIIFFKCELNIKFSQKELDYLKDNSNEILGKRNVYGMTLLMIAIIHGHINIVDFFILYKKFKKINMKDDNGNTAFEWALIYDRKEIIDLFLDDYDDYKSVPKSNNVIDITPYNESKEYTKYILKISHMFLIFGTKKKRCKECYTILDNSSIGGIPYCSIDCYVYDYFAPDCKHKRDIINKCENLYKKKHLLDHMSKDVANIVLSYSKKYYNFDDYVYNDIHDYDYDDTECDCHYHHYICICHPILEGE
jgi:hypothetical protein